TSCSWSLRPFEDLDRDPEADLAHRLIPEQWAQPFGQESSLLRLRLAAFPNGGEPLAVRHEVGDQRFEGDGMLDPEVFLPGGREADLCEARLGEPVLRYGWIAIGAFGP